MSDLRPHVSLSSALAWAALLACLSFGGATAWAQEGDAPDGSEDPGDAVGDEGQGDGDEDEEPWGEFDLGGGEDPDEEDPDEALESVDEDESAGGDEAAPEEEGTDDAEPAGDEEEGDAEAMPGGVTTTFGPALEERAPSDSRLIIPPFYLDQHGDTSTVALFPFYYNRSAPDDRQLLIGPYYRRRGLELNADVVFPFFWSFRTVDSTTVAVPPFYYNRDDDGFDWGVAPLVFDGRSGDDTYTVIPPLLTAAWANEERAFTFAGPFWRVRDGESIDWGVFPLLWASQDEVSASTILAPFYFRFSDEEERSATTVVPPVYHHVSEDQTMWGFAGLLHHQHDDEGTSWTIPPLIFHYSRSGEDLRLVTPLFGYFDVDGDNTLITPLYQRHRGDTELDAVAPLFFSYRDPRQRSSAFVIPPLVWHFGSPAGNTTLVLPVFGRWHERGRFTTWATPLVAHYESEEEASAATWIFPTVQASHTPDSTTFNIHPLLYSTSATTYRHLVLAPVYWDFEDYEDDSRATVLFPLFWRFRDGSTVSQLAGNTYYHYYREGGVPGWEFHFFPLFAYGEPRPGDHWWSVLYGLVGYRRQGRYARASALWIPFQVDGPPEASATIGER